MADVYYLGVVQAIPKVVRVSVTAVANGATYTVTYQTANKVVTYTAGAADTQAVVASNIAAAIGGSRDAEFRELTASVRAEDTSQIDVSGPADGAPFTLAVSAAGGGAIAVADVQAAKSPHDAADAANYSAALAPNDRLILQEGTFGPRYGLAALAGVALAEFVRYRSHGGAVGLPATNAAGYREWRPRFFELNAGSFYIEQAPGDAAEQMQFRVTAAGAVTIKVSGPGGGFNTTDTPVINFFGTVGASVLEGNGASVGFARSQGQTGALGAVTLANGLFRSGPLPTLGAVRLSAVAAEIAGSFTTLHINGGEVEAVGAAASTQGAGTPGTVVDAGAVRWRSTGTPGAEVTVGGDGTFDARPAPDALPAVTFNLHANSILNDDYNRLPAGSAFRTVNCSIQDVTITTGPGRTFTL